MLTPIKIYSSEDIDEINKILWEDIIKKGNHFVFGDKNKPKSANEVLAIIQIYGKAISRLYKGDIPKGWVFGAESNKEYIKMLKNPDKGEQPYTYGERIHGQWAVKEGVNDGEPYHDMVFVNQLEIHREMLKESIQTGIQTNRIWGDIGRPTDLEFGDPACWRGWQIRTSERNKVSLRLVFRSNDAGNAYMANLAAIINVMVDEVINPAGGQLEEVILIALSEHIYDNDRDFVESFINQRPKRNKWGLPI